MFRSWWICEQIMESFLANPWRKTVLSILILWQDLPSRENFSTTSSSSITSSSSCSCNKWHISQHISSPELFTSWLLSLKMMTDFVPNMPRNVRSTQKMYHAKHHRTRLKGENSKIQRIGMLRVKKFMPRFWAGDLWIWWVV